MSIGVFVVYAVCLRIKNQDVCASVCDFEFGGGGTMWNEQHGVNGFHSGSMFLAAEMEYAVRQCSIKFKVDADFRQFERIDL